MNPRTLSACLFATALTAACMLGGCAQGTGTSGDPFELPDEFLGAEFNPDALAGDERAGFDLSHLAEGYVGASAVSDRKLKLQVTCADSSYSYDLPSTGEAIVAPINMGDGSYTFRILQHMTGNTYVEVVSAQADIVLDDEFQPFLRPSVVCPYTQDSACVSLAAELARGALNEGDVLSAVYAYISQNIAYDSQKAADLANVTGYLPDPDETLASGSGICFDYASLAAAMLRSLGIPCKIVTGDVSPGNFYHAWNLVYIDGRWVSIEISVSSGQWTLIDLTFAAGDSDPREASYAQKYVY